MSSVTFFGIKTEFDAKRKRKRRHRRRQFCLPCFNLPRVTAQLEKLMGTNVVRLTDRKYMQELQKRIKEDYCATLEKRINNRVSKEMDREKNLLLHGVAESLPPEMAGHPVFLTNIKTNNVVSKKRSKLKTIREKNAERLIKQGAKWEKERLLLEEQDRLNEIEAKKRREKLLETEQLYTVEINAQGLDIMAIKSRKYTEPEINLKDFLLSEREAAVKKKFEPLDPFKDVQMMVAANKLLRRRKMKKLIEKDEGIEETEAGKQEAAAKASGKLTPETPEEGYISSNVSDKGSVDKLKSTSTTPDPPTPKKEQKSRPSSSRKPTPEPEKPKPESILKDETKAKSEEKPKKSIPTSVWI
ncbi:neurofilament medium polypeptide [Culicoides brevitarsis]|uniref:neurofilament medium polypeptide n=1 Tax=Culicoides brevitarsis TaxID=469753 RepID=UPI00307B6BAD